MNPFDGTTRPGPHLVVEMLGVADVSAPALAHHPGEPLHQAATQVIQAAAALDEWHEEVIYAARQAQRLLEPVGRGELGGARVSYAALRTAVPKLGNLLAQQDRAYGQLVESISAYRRLLPDPDSAQRSTNKSPGLGQKATPDRDDDWAVAGERRLVALEAVEAGGVRFRRTAVGEDAYVSREKAQRQDPAIWPQTVQRLLAEGLLCQDTSAGLYRPGQLLSLTPQGEAALRDARATTTRMSAALGRSTTPANSGALAHSAAVPVARTSPRPPAPADPIPTGRHHAHPRTAPTFSIASIDAQRVEDALARIGPKWTTWSAMTLAQENRPMRVRDVAAQLPFVSEQFVGKRLATMHADGLVTRDDDRRGAPYRLSALGASLAPVLRTVSDWSRAHLSQDRMAEAERVEDALRRLHLRHSTAVIQVLDSGGGPMRFVHIAEKAGLDNGLARQRLLRLQADGLVARTGSRHGDPYVLTDASQALGAIWGSLAPTITVRLPTRPSASRHGR
ncbi:winged helix-turn-helix transcriptional regulator [Streptomyces sp. NPDC001292]|uniref:winged helix-turn-helix transcriptional regulator n=1 Tax=Streptomyces sp. NPDC001292 TaxID=3364558 RepID=UPI0036A0001A